MIITNVSGGGGLKFYLRGSALGSIGDNVQTNVIITVIGYVKVSETQTSPFCFFSSVTQRLYDR